MDVRTVFFGVLLAALAILALLILQPFLVYVLAAGLLAFVCLPIHDRLAPRIGARPSAFLLVVGTVIAATVPVVLLFAVVINDAIEFSQQLGQLPELTTLEADIEAATGVQVDLVSLVRELPEQLLNVLIGGATDLFAVAVHTFLGVMLLVFLQFYLLVDGRALVSWLKRMTPLESSVQDRLLFETNRMTWAVLKGHVFVAIIEGLLGGFGLFLAGVPNVAFLTVVMIVLSFLPVIGVALVWVPAVGYLAMIGDPVSALFLFVYGSTVITFSDNYLRVLIVERDADLHPGVILIGVLGGIYLLGALGLFLGPILLAVFKATVVTFHDHFEYNSSA